MRQAAGVLFSAHQALGCGSRTALPVGSGTEEIASVAGTPGGLNPSIGCSSSVSSVPIFLIDVNRTLLRFNPPTATFSVVGTVDCTVDAGPPGTLSLPPSPPTALAVDRSGLGYLLFNNDVAGSVYEVNTNTAVCAPSDAVVRLPNKVIVNGMAFVAAAGASVETLFAFVDTGMVSLVLASLNPRTFAPTFVRTPLMRGSIPVNGVTQVMGDGAGELFQSGGGVAAQNTTIFRVDTTSAMNMIDWTINRGPRAPISAVALWGGDFYLFGAGESSSETAVVRFCPRDNSITQVAHWPSQLLLAAVQTTAPTQ